MKTSFAIALLALVGPGAGLASEGDWHSLFDGKSLAGWKANESPASWVVEDGAIVTKGDRSHLFYVGEVAGASFKNFELYAEVQTTPGSNSGIYIHTAFQDDGWPAVGYECQVVNSTHPKEDPTAYVEKKMGASIYAVRNTWAAPAKDHEWFEYRILVSGRTIRTYVDGDLICEYTEPANPWRPDDKNQRLLGSGTFAIQAHDPASIVRYRGLKVRLLPDDAPTLGAPLGDAEFDRLITKFSNDNLALIDVGLEATAENLEAARQYGVTLLYGAAPADAFVVVDRAQAPSLEALRAAVGRGQKIAFSSGDAPTLDAGRLKLRLQAIEAAGLAWHQVWAP